MTHQAFRYELDPTPAQRVLLAKHAGCARVAYNWAREERIKRFTANEGKAKFTTAIEQHRELNVLKETRFPWMYEVSKCAPQEALRDLENAFKNFHRKPKNGCGFPRKRKKGIDDKFRLTGTIKVFPRHVQLPRLGKVRSKEPTAKFKGRILSATVKRQGGDRWFVSLLVEVQRPTPAPVAGPAVGVDLGLTTFATLVSSDGSIEKISAPKPLKAKLELMTRRQRRHSKKQKGSANRRKSALKLARLHWRIANVRRDFLNKLTTRLAKTKSVIVVEDLNIEGMKKRWGRSVSDVGFYEFRRQLAYKTVWYGSRLVVADRFFASSKLCSGCGLKNNSLTLSEREWICGGCGVVHDRDENAAKNLVRLATDPTDSSSGSHAHGEVHAGPVSTPVKTGRHPRRSGKRLVDRTP